MNSSNGISEWKKVNRFFYPGLVFLTGLGLLLIYQPAWNSYFVADDFEVLALATNPAKLDLQNFIWQVFSRPEDEFSRDYRPLSYLSFGLDAWLWGLQPYGFHLTSWLWHLGNFTLFFWLLWRLQAYGLRFVEIAGAALLFVAHPITVESAVWISARVDLMASFFGLLGAHAFLSFLSTYSLRWGILVALSFFLGLLCKETSLGMPLFLLGLWIISKKPWHKSLSKLVGVALACNAAYFALRFNVLDGLRGGSLEGWETQSEFLWQYLKNLVYPNAVLYFTPLPQLGLQNILALGYCVLLACWVFKKSPLQGLQHKRWALALFLWAGSTLLPVILAKGVGPALLADRYSYFVTLSFVLSFTMLGRIFPEKLQKSYGVFLLICLIGYGFGLKQQVADWTQAGEITRKIKMRLEDFLAIRDPQELVTILNTPYEYHSAHVFNLRGPVSMLKPPFSANNLDGPLVFPLSDWGNRFYLARKNRDTFDFLQDFQGYKPIFWQWDTELLDFKPLINIPKVLALKKTIDQDRQFLEIKVDLSACVKLVEPCVLHIFRREATELGYHQWLNQKLNQDTPDTLHFELMDATTRASFYLAQLYLADQPVSIPQME